MSTDYAEKEREFLATLAADTGRDLAAWMHAIDAQKLSGKNDIIDWLRQQGFMFWKAAWLERIHSNSGLPIYGDPAHLGVEQPESPAKPVPARESEPIPSTSAKGSATLQVKAESPVQAQHRPDLAAIEEILARAKALQPLARHLLGKIEKAVPEGQLSVGTNSISIGCPGEFAVLTVSARELKLGLALAGGAIEAPFTEAPATVKGSSAITHMALLNDARQIDERLISAIREAATACQKAVTS